MGRAREKKLILKKKGDSSGGKNSGVSKRNKEIT